MKKAIIVLVILLTGFQSGLFSQTEMDIKSKISKVTVYSAGVQMESEAKFDLEQGKYLLSFKNLSPYIHEESIRVDGDGNILF